MWEKQNVGKVFRIDTVRYNWPMSAHASQAFSIVHCTDLEDLPNVALCCLPKSKVWISDTHGLCYQRIYVRRATCCS